MDTNKNDKNGKNEKKGDIYSSESDEWRLANLLRSQILRNLPTARVPKTEEAMQKWAKVMDYIVRLDKRSPKEVAMVIRYAQGNEFWKSNILSPTKLREKYDTLLMQSKRGGGGNSGADRQSASGNNEPERPPRAKEDALEGFKRASEVYGEQD